MALKIYNTADLRPEDQDLHVLFYGGVRTGKTTAATTFPAPIVLVPGLCGDELMTLAGQDIPYSKFSSAAEAIQICKDLEKDKKNGFKQTGGFRTIIVDNMTVAAQMWLGEFEASAGSNAQRDIWGSLYQTIVGMYRILHGMKGVHVIWICHDTIKTYTKTEGRTKETVAVGDFSVPGNAFTDVIAKTCIIAHTELLVTETKRLYRLWFKKHGIWTAGGWFPESMKLARELEYIGQPKHKRVHYDVLANVLGLRSCEEEEEHLFKQIRRK